MTIFATIWWMVGLRSAGHGLALVVLPPLGVWAALGPILWRRMQQSGARDSDTMAAADAARRDRIVMWASAVEGIALFVVAGIVLPSTGHREATVSAVALIVGAHFVPLARGLRAPGYYWTAAALMSLGLAGFAISELAARVTSVSAGAAVVLWLTAFAALKGHAGGESTLERPVT